MSNNDGHRSVLCMLPTISISFRGRSTGAIVADKGGACRFAKTAFSVFRDTDNTHINAVGVSDGNQTRTALLPGATCCLIRAGTPTNCIPHHSHVTFAAKGSNKQITVSRRPNAVGLHVMGLSTTAGTNPRIKSSLTKTRFAYISRSAPK